MSRVSKLSLDHTSPLYQAGVHARPFKAFSHNGKDWKTSKKEDNIIAELDRLETDTKSVLYARSPLSVSCEIGGSLELPEGERYHHLFNHFAPQVWKLTVLSAQLSKRPLPGTAIEMSPHLALLRTAFFELDASDDKVDPLDYKLAIERGIFSYMKWLPTNEFQTQRRKTTQHIGRQKLRAEQALSRSRFVSPVFAPTNDHYLTLAFGYDGEDRDIKDVMSDKTLILEVARMAYGHAMRPFLGRVDNDFQYVMRFCYSPLYGHYWVLIIPTINQSLTDKIKRILTTRWIMSGVNNAFCAVPNLADARLETVKEYLLFQIAKEGLVHTAFKREINRIYHTN